MAESSKNLAGLEKPVQLHPIEQKLQATFDSAKKDLSIGDYRSAGKHLESIAMIVSITASQNCVLDAINKILPEDQRAQKTVEEIRLPGEYYELLGMTHKFSFLGVCGVNTSLIKSEELEKKIDVVMTFVSVEEARLLRDRFGLNADNNYRRLSLKEVSRKYNIIDKTGKIGDEPIVRFSEAKLLKRIRIQYKKIQREGMG